METKRAAWIIVSVVLCLSLSGCFAGTDRYRLAEVTGTVKITSQEGFSPSSGMAVRFPSLLSTPSPQRPAIRTPDSYEYIVFVSQENSSVGSGLSSAFLMDLENNGYKHVRMDAANGYIVVEDLKRRSEPEARIHLEMMIGVESAEKNHPVTLLSPWTVGGSALRPWAIEMIRVREAWDEVGRGDGIVVAVVDTGIDFDHPAFGGPGNPHDVFLEGRDFVSDPEGVPYGPWNGAGKGESHGTRVAGIIAGQGVPGSQGSIGVAPNVQIIPVRVILKDQGSEDLIINAMNWLMGLDRPPDVINMSVGILGTCQTALHDIFQKVADMGITVVAAIGNVHQGSFATHCPGNHPRVIGVGATTVDYSRAPYSSYGPGLDIMAPGGIRQDNPLCFAGIMSPGAGRDFDCKGQGTSFSAPHVSGVAGLVLSARKVSDPEELRQLLHMTSVSLTGETKWDQETGYGLVDAHTAVTATIPQVLAIKEERGSTLYVGGSAHGTGQTTAGEGGTYRLRGLKEGTWTIIAWSDADGSGTVSYGDYFGRSQPISIRSGLPVTGVDIVATPYEGEELTFLFP